MALQLRSRSTGADWREGVCRRLPADVCLSKGLLKRVTVRSYYTLGQKAMSLPHQRVSGKLVRIGVWWVSGSTRPQGTKNATRVSVFNGTSG
eukprot:1158919-Pelagomonas_calceolata.AAC.1